jgi:gamma-glutamyltranspeptidase/glutathione hydrolase
MIKCVSYDLFLDAVREADTRLVISGNCRYAGSKAHNLQGDYTMLHKNLIFRKAIPILLLTLTASLSGKAFASACSDSSDPTRSQSVEGESFMVAAAHPLAVEAGCEVLADGGSAIDAAIAVQAVLTVIEPEASGLAGGTIITYWDNESKRVRFFDGLARAPEAVTDGLRTPTEEDVANCGVTRFSSRVQYTGRAFGVPGTLKVLDLVHQEYGNTDWQNLFGAGISLAENGFPMPTYMSTVLGERPSGGLNRCLYPDIQARYCEDSSTPKSAGSTIYNTELAQVLTEVRDGGAAVFYDPEGSIAPAIIERVSAGPCKHIQGSVSGPAVIPSLMTVQDFADYEARERDPVCDTVFGHTICSSAPPAFGGTAVLYMLKLMEHGGIKHMSPDSAEYVHLAIESSRLAQWDRREHVGDPDYNFIPVGGLLDKDYLKSRFALFSPQASVDPIVSGLPPRGVKIAKGSSAKHDPNNPFLPTAGGFEDEDMTSHVSIVDSYGNALSMTTTNNSTFGSHTEARGIMLNNVQTNFTRLDSASPGKPANIMEPKKRPRTSTAPTIVFTKKGDLKLVVGAAGGGPIPDYVAQTILGVLVQDLDPQTAINQGHFSGQGLTTNCSGVTGARSELERDTPIASLEAELSLLAPPCLRVTSLRSGLAAVEVVKPGDRKKSMKSKKSKKSNKSALLGGADPRRDGVAMGL